MSTDFRTLVKKFSLDAALIFFVAAAAFAACVFAHEAMKPVTRTVGFAGPVVFATIAVALIPILGLAGKYAWAARARRLLLGVGIGSVVVFAAMFRAETFYAPIAYLQGATPQEVLAKIASGEDVPRFQAWSRMITLSNEQKEDIARELGPLIAGDDEAARRSAILTLEFPLRRHTLTMLVTLMPDLQTYVAMKAQGSSTPMPPRVQQVGQFTSAFVARNFRSILKALGPKDRDKLPPRGMDALFLALATEEPIGHLILKGFAEQGDETLKPLAQSTIKVASLTL